MKDFIAFELRFFFVILPKINIMIIRNATPSDARFLAKCVMAGVQSLYSSVGFTLDGYCHAFGVDFRKMVYVNNNR